LIVYFLIALILSFFHLQLFFPLMALCALRLSRAKALWVAFAAGLFFDLVASDHYLGYRAALFVVVMALLHSSKRFVFEEKCVPFSVYSMLFGTLYTLMYALIQTIGPPHFVWSFEFVAVDLLLMPLADGLLGFLIFIAPHSLIRFFKRNLLRFKRDDE
jgi:rod shape-determining protein MreD